MAAGPRLHGARSEASAVATVHRVSPLLDDAATVDAVLDALATAGLVHLAAHGRLSADNPLFSDLLRADGPLVVYDVERLARVPHTVVLAACDSGRSVVRTGDELLGLSATFIGRGAAQLVASVLPVPDAETAPLMVAFHRGLASGSSPAAALAAAQQQLAGSTSADPAALAAAAGFVASGQAESRGAGVLGLLVDGDRRAGQVFLVAQQLDVVVRRTLTIVVVQMDRDHVNRLAEPRLHPPQPRRASLQRGRQVVVAELHRAVRNALHPIPPVGRPRQVHRDTEVVEFELDCLLAHRDSVTPRHGPHNQP